MKTNQTDSWSKGHEQAAVHRSNGAEGVGSTGDVYNWPLIQMVVLVSHVIAVPRL